MLVFISIGDTSEWSSLSLSSSSSNGDQERLLTKSGIYSITNLLQLPSQFIFISSHDIIATSTPYLSLNSTNKSKISSFWNFILNMSIK